MNQDPEASQTMGGHDACVYQFKLTQYMHIAPTGFVTFKPQKASSSNPKMRIYTLIPTSSPSLTQAHASSPSSLETYSFPLDTIEQPCRREFQVSRILSASTLRHNAHPVRPAPATLVVFRPPKHLIYMKTFRFSAFFIVIAGTTLC